MTTADHRKAIPVKVKLQVAINQARCASCSERLGSTAETEFDHRPPLCDRPWIEDKQDYNPPQLDPAFIEALHCDCHLWRTSGRKPGAEVTTSTRGSDVGELARTASIIEAQEEFRRRILTKEPGKSARPPSKWPSRKFRRAA